MKHPIRTPDDLALALRAVRKSAGLRQDDLAGAVGVSRQFAVDVEKGKPTVQLGKVLQLLAELGIALSVDIPDDAGRTLDRLKLETRPRAAARPKPRAAPGAS